MRGGGRLGFGATPASLLLLNTEEAPDRGRVSKGDGLRPYSPPPTPAERTSDPRPADAAPARPGAGSTSGKAGSPARVSFRFIDEAGAAVAGAQYRVIADGRQVKIGSGDSSGGAVATLPAGRRFDLVVTAPGRSTAIRSGVACDRADPIEIRLPAPATIAGFVSTMDGIPLVGCAVTATPQRPQPPSHLALSEAGRSGTTDAEGRFTIRGLNPTEPLFRIRLGNAELSAPLAVPAGIDELQVRCAPRHLVVVRRGPDTGRLRWRLVERVRSRYRRQVVGNLPEGMDEVVTIGWAGECDVEFQTRPSRQRRSVKITIPAPGGSVVAVDPGTADPEPK